VNPKIVGVTLGGVTGAALIWCGVLKAFLLLLCIFAGWVIGKTVAGELDVIDLYQRYISNRRKG
jgi:hypothetical protein